jgi:hypothetical protein
MKDERKRGLQEVVALERDRALAQRVYGSEDGLQMLAWLGNECGAWAMDPAAVKPELVALFNRLCALIGIVRPDNLFELAKRYMQAANYEDLAELRKQINKQEGT